MTPFTCLKLSACVALACSGITGAAYAQASADPVAPPAEVKPAPAVSPVEAKPVPVVINYRERPRFPFDPQRLQRKPALDGIISAGEWDPFYTIGDGPVTGSVYLNWDQDFLYVAARTDQAAWVVFDIDCNGDGWLRGADNLEITVAPLTVNKPQAVSVRLLDAASGKDTPVWNETVVNPASIAVAQQAAGSGAVVEMAIPKGIAGLQPRANATLGFRADFLPAASAPAPTQPYEPHLLLDVTLVESRAIGTPGVAPRLILDDSKVIPGQQMVATLELMNQTDAERHVRSVTWKGEGPAADILKSVREVSIPPLKGLKNLRLRYTTPLPETAIPGFYQLTGQAEMDDGRTVVATGSFSIVEPLSVQMSTEPEGITVMGPTQFKAFVTINSAVPGYCKGPVELQVPAGWEVKGRSKKDFVVERQDGQTRAMYYVTAPSSTPAGEYTLYATVSWRDKTYKVRKSITVGRLAGPSETPAPSTKSTDTTTTPPPAK